MPRAVWIILGVAAGLIALLLLAVAIAIATVDPNRFVAPLATRIKAETGRTLSVRGPVEVKLSLEPKIVLPDVAFENAAWPKPRDMLTAKRVEAQIALLPLLSRRFEVVQFTLIDPVIMLETDANGHGNWEFTTATARQSPWTSSAGPTPEGFGIANFEIRNGTLTYRNGATGKLTNASIERMTLHARSMQAPVGVDFRGKVDDVPVALSGELGPAEKWIAQQWPYPVAIKGEIDGKAAQFDTRITRSGATTRLDDLSVAWGAIAGKGSLRATSEGDHTRYTIDFALPTLSLADLASKPALAANQAAVPAAATRWIIPDTPLPLAPLASVDADGSLSVGELSLRDGQQIRQVGTRFTARNANLDAKFTAGAILGGSLRGELQFDGRRADAPGVRLVLAAQDLDLAALAAAAGIKRDIRGGKVRADVDINGRGATPHRVASTMSGTILVVSGPASLGRMTLQGQSALAQLAGALDPLQSVDAATELRCAVFRLPLTNGLAHVDRSIAIETGKVAASASGTLDFRDETLDLSVQPQIREGIKIDVTQFASLVRIRGPFDKPAVAIDAAQSAQMLAKIGALGATGGGLAAIGGVLLGSTSGEYAPCRVAMTGKGPRGKAASRPSQERTPDLGLPQDVGKALGRLLGR